uniref:Uncharacterized protein n=1 Tax=Helianthus annuus TaxID=4232 RepID=A0A251V7K8_HELAN
MNMRIFVHYALNAKPANHLIDHLSIPSEVLERIRTMSRWTNSWEANGSKRRQRN